MVWHELVLAVFLFSDMAQFEYKLSKLRRDQLQSGANLHKSISEAAIELHRVKCAMYVPNLFGNVDYL